MRTGSRAEGSPNNMSQDRTNDLLYEAGNRVASCHVCGIE